MSSFHPGSLAIRTGHFIDGRLVEAAGEDVEVLRPSDGRAYVCIPLGDADMVD